MRVHHELGSESRVCNDGDRTQLSKDLSTALATRFTHLSRLPSFDIIAMSLIDLMHNILLGMVHSPLKYIYRLLLIFCVQGSAYHNGSTSTPGLTGTSYASEWRRRNANSIKSMHIFERCVV